MECLLWRNAATPHHHLNSNSEIEKIVVVP